MTSSDGIGPDLVAGYLDRLDRVDQAGAVRLATGLLDQGYAPADVLVDLVAVAQREIGRRWLTGAWSVAREHAATHVSEVVVGAVAGRITTPPRRGHVVVACVEGEWHALAARIVAEVVRDAGWRVTFLGASVPGRHLVTYLHQTGPDAVLLSCVQSNRLIRAARMVEACRAAGVPVLAGGPGFGWDGRWAAAVGAAAWGATARDAVRLLARGLPGAAHTGPTPAPPDDGYVAVLHRRREIVQVALRELDPPEETAEDVAAGVGHLVDALAAAIRVDDRQLLLDFVGWQAEALASRGGRRPVDAMLAAAERTLIEHPRAVEDLRAARAALTTD
ncbi:cobalamin B12-binding domain-containing protein [Micromonospora auratinigra]|uniref:Methanogenic corrinoid protein MtbC1 n=1 Tax=Micromonospora auratinigra TaxID=261654 RepID=A0A1A8ZRP7_9ACTN|nr:cobalamin B12-binding domain-containing protein [Micromonospora auratinigra]SBT46536.1 Methanogenic corrinoid protein MtbC1 [Micromonospora auratinigra]